MLAVLKKIINKRRVAASMAASIKNDEQKQHDIASAEIYMKIINNADWLLIKKNNYGYQYKTISIISVVETDGINSDHYFILRTEAGDEIKSKNNRDIYNLLNQQWNRFANERINLIITAL